MKKIYFAITAICSFVAVHAQGPAGKELQPIGGSLTPQVVTVSGRTLTTTPGGTGLSGTTTHNCKAHELTEQHYTGQGLNYNQMVLDDHSQIASEAPIGTNKTPGSNTISVIFHVVHNTPAENVSNALIMQVYNDLVEDFQLLNADASGARTAFGFIPADANINFCLATQTPAGVPLAEQGVVRVATSETFYDSDNGEENKMKSAVTGGSTIWNRNNYLNIWICDISNGASSGTAGYAYRPVGGVLPGSTIDGIVLDYNLGMNNENVLTHEVGHYLGLDHTWGGSGSCGSDDGFTDTPNTQGPSFNFPGSCSGNQTTCGATQTQYENYMDYANCTCMFTTQQANHMLTVLTGIRGSLLLSPGCDPTNTPPNSAFTADIASPIIIPVGASVNLIDQSTNVPTGWAWVLSGTAGVNWVYAGGTNATSQNPLVTFLTVGTYNVTLTASNVYGVDATPEVKIGYIQVVAPAVGTACDTLRNYNPVTEDPAAYWLNFAGFADWGYMPGHSGYDFPPLYNITHYADRYVSPTTAEVRRLRFPVYEVTDQGAAGFIRVQVTNETAGSPGTTIYATDTIYFADLDAGFYNEFDFTNPGTVTGAFWVTLQYYYSAPQDTVVFGVVNLADRQATTGINTMKQRVNGAWYTPMTLYGSATFETSLYMDVMLSNGPAPVANMTFSESDICPGGQVVVNGAGSTNTTTYQWFQTDEPVTTIIASSTSGGATFTFGGPAGDYNIFLFADGSCKTDGVFLPVTVDPAVNASASVLNTTCGYNNGSITVTGATGGSGVYEYKLNSGGWQSSNVFTNLAAGSYTVYVKTTGDNCDYSFVANVGASTAFTTATVSSNQTICPGGNANITAGGGVSYSWSDGATVLGTTGTINVTPANTTAYTCTVTDGSGCIANVNTTVTVNPLDDASFAFFDFCDGAPNNATSIATPGGVFSFNPAPGDGATINPTTGEISNEVVGTTYSVQYAVNAVCANSSIETVLVNTSDDAQFTTGNYCSGGTNTVTGIATPGGTFTFDGVLPATINPSTGVISSGVAGATYQITYTTPAGVCQSVSAPVSVTVNTTPTMSSVTGQSVCNGVNFTAVNFTGTGGTTYNWTNTNSAIGIGASGSGNIAAFAGTGTTLGGPSISGTVTVTPVIGSCFGTPVNFTLTVNSTPDVNAGTDQTVCTGTAVTLSGFGASSYTWDNGVTDGVSFTPALGTIVYTVTGTDANLCSNTDAVSVTVNNLDDPSFTTSNICGASSNIVTNIITSGGVFSYDGTDASSINPATGEITGGVVGTTYNVIYTTPASACQAVSAPVAVTVFDNPAATGSVTNDDGTTNGTIDVTVTTGTAPYSFVWDHGPTTEDLTGLAAGTYGVTITDANGCEVYESFTVISTVGIDTNPLADVLVIYPNPTSGALTVTLTGEFNLSITDSRGRLVHQKSGTDNVLVDLGQYESGIYFISVQQGENIIVKKIVKQ